MSYSDWLLYKAVNPQTGALMTENQAISGIDGGGAATNFLINQNVDGGTANEVYPADDVNHMNGGGA